MISTLHGSIQQEVTTLLSNLNRKWRKPGLLLKAFSGLFYSYFITQRPVLDYSRQLITVSERVTKDLQKWFGTGVSGKCTTIYNGVDTNVFRPDGASRELFRKKFSISEKECVLLTLGRLTYEKGYHLVVEALALLRRELPHLKLLIVGGGDDSAFLKAAADYLGVSDKVVFTGPVGNRETSSYYNASDIFLCPTMTIEGLPFVILEAMACGKPVIASDRGGNCEAIRDGITGILIGNCSPGALAERIALLATKPGYAERLGRAGREKVEEDFSVDRMVGLTEKHMLSLVASMK